MKGKPVNALIQSIAWDHREEAAFATGKHKVEIKLWSFLSPKEIDEIKSLWSQRAHVEFDISDYKTIIKIFKP